MLAFLQDDARLLETITGWADGLRLADCIAFVHELTTAEREADTLAGDDNVAL